MKTRLVAFFYAVELNVFMQECIAKPEEQLVKNRLFWGAALKLQGCRASGAKVASWV